MPVRTLRSRLSARTADLVSPRTVDDHPDVAKRVTPPWLKYLLGAACLAAVVAAALAIGPAGAPAARARIVTAARGVVQSTVSGSGTIEGSTQESVNFQTGGQLQDVFVSVGQRVHAGQLLAQLDPTQATLGVDQAQANLSSAEARLAQAEAPGGASAGGSSGGSGSTGASGSTTAVQGAAAKPKRTQGKPSSGGARGQTQTQRQTTASPPATTRTTTTPAASAQATAAALASAQASVDSAQIAVDSAQKSLADTKLYAPAPGTVAAINAKPGDSVGGGGSTPSRSMGNGASSGSGQASQGGGGTTGTTTSGASSATSQGSSSSPGFIELVDTTSFQLVVPVSESDISKLHPGQAATVTVNALPGQEMAGHVASIDTLPTTSSGVVSYNVTFDLDQPVTGLRPGMTATAQIVVSQVSGVVSVPTAAVSRRGGAATVTLVRGGKTVTQPVVTGLAGDNATQVISGVDPGDRVEIPIVTTTGAGAAAGRGFGAGAFGGGGGLGSGGLGGGGVRRFGGGG